MASNHDELVQIEELKNCFQKQLDELDMLQSIYCNPGEFHLQDIFTQIEISDFLQNKSKIVSSKLTYTISFTLSEDSRTKVEVNIELPHLYPSIESASIRVRSSAFSTAQEKLILRKIEDFIETQCDKTEPYVFQVVSMIQENLDEFSKNLQGTSNETQESEFVYERLWIYSHHIKSKTKRQNIIKSARDLSLTGFMRPGKPGIICVEGLQENVQEFWKIIRQWTWQKIQIRKSEVKKSHAELFKFGKFDQFREQIFTTNEENDEEIPMNMSLFMKFLQEHDCTYIKDYIFGF